MDWQPYIHSDPAILVGKPVVKGTRLAVEFLLQLYAAGWTEAQILESYPTLMPEALQAIHSYADNKGTHHGDSIEQRRAG